MATDIRPRNEFSGDEDDLKVTRTYILYAHPLYNILL